MKIFVTGTAGFIAFYLAHRLLADGHTVTGYDGVTNYYHPALKRSRLEMLVRHDKFVQIEGMLEDTSSLDEAVAGSDAKIVVHLAVQAGVRNSLEAPQSYI